MHLSRIIFFDRNEINTFFVVLFFIVETSVRPYVGLEKFLVFVFPFVSVWCENGHRNYPTHLKFGTNIYMLCEISCIVFGVH